MAHLLIKIEKNKVTSLKITKSDNVVKFYKDNGYVSIGELSGHRFGSVTFEPTKGIKNGDEEIDFLIRHSSKN